MPFVKLTRPTLIGRTVQPRGHVFECDHRQAEHYSKSGAGVVVPAGTPPDLETTKAERSAERATRR
jgi:hypothetical protein